MANNAFDIVEERIERPRLSREEIMLRIFEALLSNSYHAAYATQDELLGMAEDMTNKFLSRINRQNNGNNNTNSR